MVPSWLICAALLLGQSSAPFTHLLVPEIAAQGVTPELAAALTEVVLTRLGAVPGIRVTARSDLLQLLDQEQQRQMVGCGEDAACFSALAGALDAERLVRGSLARIGEQYLLSLALLDIRKAAVVRRVSRTTLAEESLVAAAGEAVEALWADGDVPVERCVDCDTASVATPWQGAIRAGNNFATFFAHDLDVHVLNLGVDIDLGYQVWSRVSLFGTVGLRLTSIDRETDTVTAQIVPVSLGARWHSPGLWEDFHAYLALSTGLGILRTHREGAERTMLRAALSGRGYAGLVYDLSDRVGLLGEVSYEITANTPAVLRHRPLTGATLALGMSYGY